MLPRGGTARSTTATTSGLLATATEHPDSRTPTRPTSTTTRTPCSGSSARSTRTPSTSPMTPASGSTFQPFRWFVSPGCEQQRVVSSRSLTKSLALHACRVCCAEQEVEKGQCACMDGRGFVVFSYLLLSLPLEATATCSCFLFWQMLRFFILAMLPVPCNNVSSVILKFEQCFKLRERGAVHFLLAAHLKVLKTKP